MHHIAQSHKWRKLGQVFCSSGEQPWMASHATNCVAEHLQDDTFRIYFSCRDDKQRSHIAFVDVDINQPHEVLSVSQEPVLEPGEEGAFDDSGVTLSCIISANNTRYLFYLGWNLGVTVPWRNSIGLAVWNSQTKRFERYSQAPLLDRSHVDPFTLSYPYVLQDQGIYRMWYGSSLRWRSKLEDMIHVMKSATSLDLIHWQRTASISLNLKDESEYAITRPFVLKEDGLYRMWYSYRGEAYRIGYAESKDAMEWVRKDDEVGITVGSPGEWDSEMICYPHLFQHKGRRLMLYNGNGSGKTGFGLAEWSGEP